MSGSFTSKGMRAPRSWLGPCFRGSARPLLRRDGLDDGAASAGLRQGRLRQPRGAMEQSLDRGRVEIGRRAEWEEARLPASALQDLPGIREARALDEADADAVGVRGQR